MMGKRNLLDDHKRLKQTNTGNDTANCQQKANMTIWISSSTPKNPFELILNVKKNLSGFYF